VAFEHKVILVEMLGKWSQLVDIKDEARWGDHKDAYEAPRVDALLDELSADGWELPGSPVAVGPYAGTLVYTFRRQLR
jgi:hypothetical protein